MSLKAVFLPWDTGKTFWKGGAFCVKSVWSSQWQDQRGQSFASEIAEESNRKHKRTGLRSDAAATVHQHVHREKLLLKTTSKKSPCTLCAYFLLSPSSVLKLEVWSQLCIMKRHPGFKAQMNLTGTEQYLCFEAALEVLAALLVVQHILAQLLPLLLVQFQQLMHIWALLCSTIVDLWLLDTCEATSRS